MAELKTPRQPLWKQMLMRRLRGLAMLVLALLAIALGIYLLAPQWIVRADQWRQARAAHLERRDITAGGTRWAYYEGGSGPTVVLLHGFTGSKDNWLKVARELTPNFHVIIPDLPGWGDSQRLADAAYGAPEQARRLATFVDQLELHDIILIGHSMGGLIAGLYAGEHADKVAAVGFIDSDGVGHQRAAADAGHNVFAYQDAQGFERMMGLVFAQPPHLPGRIEDVFVQRNLNRMGMLKRTFGALRRPAQAHGLEVVLPKLDKPVLVLWCHGDRIIDAKAVDVFRKGLKASPRIDVTTLFGCSHMPMLEKPGATAQAIVRFMLPPYPPAARTAAH